MAAKPTVTSAPALEQASAADVKISALSLGGELSEARAAAWFLRDLDGGSISENVPEEHADWLRSMAIDTITDALDRAAKSHAVLLAAVGAPAVR